MDKPLFELRGVEYSYMGKFPALCGIDLTIEAGSKSAVIGANGSGKSSLLAMLDALIFPDKGSIKAYGRELKGAMEQESVFARSFRKRVGFVFQNPDVQLFCPTVREEIIFGPLQLGMEKQQIQEQLERLVALFGLKALLERPAYQLSIGEKKKVAIASVLAISPEVLLLDEPTAGLDPRTTCDIIDTILAANEEGRTVITATHDLHVASEIADCLHVLGREKKIIRSGVPQEILSDERFLQEHNLIHIHRHRHDGKIHRHIHQHPHQHA